MGWLTRLLERRAAAFWSSRPSRSTVILIGEVAARLLSSNLPEPQRWQSIEAQQKVEQMDRLKARDGAEIVFVGTSLVNVAIDPSIVERGLGPDVDVYNGALSAGVPSIMEPWTTSVVLPRLHPKVVVLGLSTFDFYDHVSAEEFRKALVALAGRQAGNGRREPPRQGEPRDRRRFESVGVPDEPAGPEGGCPSAIRGNRPQAPEGEFGEVTEDGRTGAKQHAAAWQSRAAWRASGGLVARGPQPGCDPAVDHDGPAHGCHGDRRQHAGDRSVHRPPSERRRPTTAPISTQPAGSQARLGVPFLEVPFSRSTELFFDQVHLLAGSGDRFTEQLTERLRQQPAVEKVRTGSR